jgi:two-component system, chemotaxis family, CheB/CheR fusion protein
LIKIHRQVIKTMTTIKKDKAKAPSAPVDAKGIETFEQTGKSVETQDIGVDTNVGFPIIGIGASAGGLAAFEAFFSGMPDEIEPGMAFVLVQHLAPDHKSILTELVQRYTRMEVFEVEDGMSVRPNCAYIIPPGRDMAFIGGTLQLLEPSAPRGQRMPIDFFFRSLAQDQLDRAVGIVLSGTGSDGTLGVRAIKGNGGMVMVQNPASTEYDGMPRSALSTGLVDYELPPAEMPARIIAYATHAFGKSRSPVTEQPPKAENALKKIFILLRAYTGHDFSQYKPSTVHRRIERRMAIHQIATIDEYVRYLQQAPYEGETLFRDILIGVTNFFRDPEAFRAVKEQIIPRLFIGKSLNSVIRVWSAGCSTGEEAYSLAILLAEHQESMKQSLKVQIFASDIDIRSIAAARAGLYPLSIAADISPEHLKRYFSEEPDGSFFRINKGIRDMVVFSEHNVIKDPPFSKLDLISCRNLLIYVDSELQKKIIPLFHYALNPGGFLFLGTSETVGDFGSLFTTLDRKLKLYQRKEDFHRTGLREFLPPMTVAGGMIPHAFHKTEGAGKPSLREMTEKMLLQHVAPVAALINANGDILYLHGRTGLYLEPTPGEAGVNNILKMAREGLRRELVTALYRAAAGQKVVRCPKVRVKINGDFTTVNLTVCIMPVEASADTAGSSEASLFLVILEQAANLQTDEGVSTEIFKADAISDTATGDGANALIVSLQQELQAKEEYLQTANEELRSSNEEMQSVNEELQSTNEELETSKEELQSVNEELFTVNAELQTKVADLTRANNDMNNLLAGTGIATVFVDHNLRILRFTPAATRIINLIQSDIGRPVGHIVSNLMGYNTLPEDTQAVLDTLSPKEVEVQTRTGAWYTMLILPYRTLDNVIEGAVITFVDISAAKRSQEALHEAHIRVTEAIVATVHEPLVVLDPDLRIILANRPFYSTFRIAPESAVGRLLYDLDNRQWDIPALRKLLEKILPKVTVFNNYVISHEFEDIGMRTIKLNACMVSEEGQAEFILLAIEDINEQKNIEGSL